MTKEFKNKDQIISKTYKYFIDEGDYHCQDVVCGLCWGLAASHRQPDMDL